MDYGRTRLDIPRATKRHPVPCARLHDTTPSKKRGTPKHDAHTPHEHRRTRDEVTKTYLVDTPKHYFFIFASPPLPRRTRNTLITARATDYNNKKNCTGWVGWGRRRGGRSESAGLTIFDTSVSSRLVMSFYPRAAMSRNIFLSSVFLLFLLYFFLPTAPFCDKYSYYHSPPPCSPCCAAVWSAGRGKDGTSGLY